MSEEYIVNNFENLLLNCPPKVLNVELKKMRKNLQRRIWRCKNREKERERVRKWKRQNPEKIKESDRKYRKNNLEKLKEKDRERGSKYRKNNHEKEIERQKKYRKDNPEKIKESRRKWRVNNPEKQHKIDKKANWRKAGLNMENFEEIYERYINTTHCDMCEVFLTVDKVNTKTTKCMDHSHITGEFRRVICNSCNAKLPKYT